MKKQEQGFIEQVFSHKGMSFVAVLSAIAVSLCLELLHSPAYAVGLVIGAAFAIFVVINYEDGMVIILMIIYMRVSDNLIQYAGLPSILQPLLVLLLGALALRMFTTDLSITPGVRAGMLMLIYIISYVVSCVTAHDPDLAMTTIDDMPKDLIIVFLIATICSNMKMMSKVCKALTICGLIMGCVVVYQYVTNTYDNEYYGFGRAMIQNITSGTDDYRAAGVVGDPNYFGMIMVALVPIAFFMFTLEKRTFFKILYGVSLFFIVMGIVTTFSRGDFLALIVVAAAICANKKPKPVYVVLVIVIIAMGFTFLPQDYQERIFSISELTSTDASYEDVSFVGRFSEAIVALRMLSDYPFVGVGINNYNPMYASYAYRIGLDARTERMAHNIFLQIGAEQGLFGLFAFILGMVVVIRGALGAYHEQVEAGNSENADIIMAIILAFTGLMTCSMFLHQSYFRYYWILFALMAALPSVSKHTLLESYE